MFANGRRGRVKRNPTWGILSRTSRWVRCCECCTDGEKIPWLSKMWKAIEPRDMSTLSAGPAKTSRTVAKTFAWAASKSRLESRLRWKIQRYYHLLKQWEINLWMFLPSQRTCKRQKLAWESCVKTCHRSNLLSPLWRKSCQWKLFLLLSKELTDRPCPAMFGTHHWQSW